MPAWQQRHFNFFKARQIGGYFRDMKCFMDKRFFQPHSAVSQDNAPKAEKSLFLYLSCFACAKSSIHDSF